MNLLHRVHQIVAYEYEVQIDPYDNVQEVDDYILMDDFAHGVDGHDLPHGDYFLSIDLNRFH